MEEITEHNLMHLIKEKFPEFIPYSEAYKISGESDLAISNNLIPFLDYTVIVIKSEDYNKIEKIFEFTEFLMWNGNGPVLDVIAICFLEGLLNKDPHEIQFVKFSKYLGKRSISYLRAWNQFQGTYTEGL